MATVDLTDKQVDDALKAVSKVTVERTLPDYTAARVTFYREDGVLRAAISLGSDSATAAVTELADIAAVEKLLKRCVHCARGKLGAK